MNIQNVHIHIGSSALCAAALAALMSFDATEPARTDKARAAAPKGTLTPPPIGNYWHGQGGINAGLARGVADQRDAWLIVPTDPQAVRPKRALGTYGVDVQGASSDVDGMANTVALAKAGSDLCKDILALEIDGHSDFFLMARADARLCMANVPELFEKEWYLTSTQYSSSNAWNQDFDYGTQYASLKKFEARWRPVRRLIL